MEDPTELNQINPSETVEQHGVRAFLLFSFNFLVTYCHFIALNFKCNFSLPNRLKCFDQSLISSKLIPI